MTEVVRQPGQPISASSLSQSPARRSPILGKEDWWAIWIGLFATGKTISWIAVAPQKWSHWSEVSAQLVAHWRQYVALFVLWAGLFGIGTSALGIRVAHFLPSFAFV
jgi:hypothetical protein